MPVSALIGPCEINVYFQGINNDPNYTAPESLQIAEGTRIPSLYIHTVQHLLQRQKYSVSGPDDLLYWSWKEFAKELAPVTTAIFNSSLKVSRVPKVWKFANVLPLSKESPLNHAMLPIKTYLINRHYHEIIRKKCV